VPTEAFAAVFDFLKAGNGKLETLNCFSMDRRSRAVPARADEDRVVFSHLMLAFGANIAPTLLLMHFLGPANTSAFRTTHNVFWQKKVYQYLLPEVKVTLVIAHLLILNSPSCFLPSPRNKRGSQGTTRYRQRSGFASLSFDDPEFHELFS